MSKAVGPYIFRRYAVDAARRRLLCEGVPVSLNGKAFDLLLVLVSNDGIAFSREDLYERLWPEGTVEDGNLSQNVYLVRRALDPNGDGREYIETIPRFGYRFAAPVRMGTGPTPKSAVLWSAAAALLLVASLAIAGSSATSDPPSLNNAAREALALGTYHLSLRSESELSYARSYFKTAIARAPQFAAGYAGLASAEALAAEFTRNRLREQREVALARNYRDKALRLNPSDPDALAVSGFIAYRFDGNEGAAKQYLAQAISVDAGNAAAHQWQGVLLLGEGRTRAALAELEAAHRLQPTYEGFSRWLARAYEYSHRPDEAIRLALEALRIEPGDVSATMVLACAQEQRGNLAKALRTLRALAVRDPDERFYVVADEARLAALLHRKALPSYTIGEIDRLADRHQVDPFEATLYYLTVGLDERAAKMFRENAQLHMAAGLQKYDPRLESLHGLSRLHRFFV